MTSNKQDALLVLEGSDRTESGLLALRNYVAELRMRVTDELPWDNFHLECEIVALLRRLEAAADPTGDSPYRLKIVTRREGPGAPPNPAAKQHRSNMAVMAAVTADKLRVAHPEMQKKEANSRAAHTWGVTVGELYAARKAPLYDDLREHLAKK